MRIIGQIDHPSLKISVFKNDGKTSLKFENAGYEITLKLGDDEKFQTLEGIQQLANTAFVDRIATQLQQVHQLKLAAMAQLFPSSHASEFETII